MERPIAGVRDSGGLLLLVPLLGRREVLGPFGNVGGSGRLTEGGTAAFGVATIIGFLGRRLNVTKAITATATRTRRPRASSVVLRPRIDVAAALTTRVTSARADSPKCQSP